MPDKQPIDMNLVDADVVEKYLAEYELEIVQSDTENVKTLTDYFAERGKTEGITLAQCDCGGTSDAELEECPFCGDAEPVDGLSDDESEEDDEEDDDSEDTAESDADAESEEDDDEEEEEEDDEPEAAAESESEEDDDEEEEDEEEEEPEPIPAPKKKVKGKKAKKAAAKKAAADKKAADKKAAKKKKQPKDAKKTKKAKPAKKEKGPLEDQEATPSSPRKPGEASTDIVVFTTEDLDKQVTLIKSTGKMAATELLKMGEAFERIHADELWKLRTAKGGKPKYTNFKKFVAEEFGVSHTYAYGLMDVAKKFTVEDVKRLGISKLRVALQAPAERQKEILDAAGKGATVADLKDKARKDRPEAKKAITVALLLGQQVVPAFKRTDPDARATKAKDDPFGELELDNGVMLSIKLTKDTDGNLRFIVEAKRGSSE